MNAVATPAETAYSLRQKLWAAKWIPVRAENPGAGVAGEWKRLKLLHKSFLMALLSSIKGSPSKADDWCVPAPKETREERFFSKRRLAEMFNCSRRTVQRSADLLVRLGLLERRKRDWGANRWQICATQLRKFLAWNAAIEAQAEEERLAAALGREVETLPPAPAPVVEPLHFSRAERRADASSAPWEPRPTVARLWGVFDLPELVEWALGRADWVLARSELPEWATKAEQRASAPAQDFARLVLAWSSIVHGDCARTELLSFASGYARRLSVLWRGAGRPAPEELLPLIATVEWARLARVLDRKVIQGGRAGLVTPRASAVLTPGDWSAHLQRALDARRAALAEAAAVVEAPVVEAEVAEVDEVAQATAHAVSMLTSHETQVRLRKMSGVVAIELARFVLVEADRHGADMGAVAAAHASLVVVSQEDERRRRGPEPG